MGVLDGQGIARGPADRVGVRLVARLPAVLPELIADGLLATAALEDVARLADHPALRERVEALVRDLGRDLEVRRDFFGARAREVAAIDVLGVDEPVSY